MQIYCEMANALGLTIFDTWEVELTQGAHAPSLQFLWKASKKTALIVNECMDIQSKPT